MFNYSNLTGAAIGGVFDIGATALNNYMAEEREKNARAENYRYGEMAADNADIRTRNLYNSFYSPTAQLKLIREAGLSPSLMYSQGAGAGGAGQAGAQGSGAQGIQPNVYGVNPLEAAQIGLISAQTQKTKEETKTERGENARGIAELEKLYKENNYTEAATSLAKANTEQQELLNYITDQTKECTIDEICQRSYKMAEDAKKAFYDANIAGNNLEISNSTKESIIEEQKERVKNLIADTNKKIKDAKLSEAQIEQAIQWIDESQSRILQEWQKIDNERRNVRAYEKLIKAETYKMYKEAKFIPENFNQKEREIWLDFLADVLGCVSHLIGNTASLKSQ